MLPRSGFGFKPDRGPARPALDTLPDPTRPPSLLLQALAPTIERLAQRPRLWFGLGYYLAVALRIADALDRRGELVPLRHLLEQAGELATDCSRGAR
jgi:hypothetical protein